MSIPEIGPLSAELSRAADGVIDAMINTAAREVTATGCDLVAAMDNAWMRLAVETPEVWALAVIRLKQTGNDELLAYATRGRAS